MRNSQRTFTCRGDSGSFYFQSRVVQSSDGTYCMCIRFLSFLVHVHRPFESFQAWEINWESFFAPRLRVNTQREEKNWQGKATVLILQECGVLLKCHNSESSLLNPLIQSQGDNYHQLVDFLDPHPFASVADPVASIASSAIPLDLLVSLHACLLLLLRSSTLLPRRCVAVIGQIRFICSIVPSPRFTHDTNPLLLFLFDHHPIVPGRNESSPSAAAATPHPPLPEFQIPSSLYRHWYIVSSLVRWKCIGVGVGTGIIIAHRRQ